ncbi:MAG TPA: hypothetical protein VFR28_07030 [Allosphingosinicella sp.]|jgi:hypothetical protein|nr:hypothetical protein [Allosphingosinicella sp.]
MPRYYFHLAREGGRLEDEEGLALPDAEAAWYQAVRSARELIRAEPALGVRWDRQSIEIVDEGGAPIDQVALADIVHYAL